MLCMAKAWARDHKTFYAMAVTQCARFDPARVPAQLCVVLYLSCRYDERAGLSAGAQERLKQNMVKHKTKIDYQTFFEFSIVAEGMVTEDNIKARVATCALALSLCFMCPSLVCVAVQRRTTACPNVQEAHSQTCGVWRVSALRGALLMD